MLNQPWPDSFSHVSQEDSVNQHIRASLDRSCVCFMQNGPDSRSLGAVVVSLWLTAELSCGSRNLAGRVQNHWSCNMQDTEDWHSRRKWYRLFYLLTWWLYFKDLQVFCKAYSNSFNCLDEPVPPVKAWLLVCGREVLQALPAISRSH